MGQVVFMVEPESVAGARWCIKRGGSVRATYRSLAQAVMDARQLAAFENELHGLCALVRVLDARRNVAQDFVCDDVRVPSAMPAQAAPSVKATHPTPR